ncbi:MAG: alpha/beta hydrolase [Armatimonadetes bacterium]|nr:alpha/beta hydrolase [Armatimonadota bacterium]
MRLLEGLPLLPHRWRVCLAAFLFFIFFFVIPAQAFDEDHKEKINGTTLHFRVRGADKNKPYLLILHGGPGFSAHMFYPWGKSIESSVNVVYLDQRGSGESERLTFATPFAPTPEEVKTYTVSTLLTDIEGVRRFLGINKWYVLGHSWGGMLGVEYAAAFPGSVEGFLFVDGLLSQPMAQEAILTFAEKQVASDKMSKEPSKQARAKRLAPFLPYAGKLPPGREKYLSTMQFAFALFGEMYYANPNVHAEYQAKIGMAMKEYAVPMASVLPANEPPLALIVTDNYATRDVSPLLQKVKCKTLIINGDKDGLIPLKTTRAVQSGIPAAKLIIFKDCGHFPFAEQPALFTKTVLNFVSP